MDPLQINAPVDVGVAITGSDCGHKSYGGSSDGDRNGNDGILDVVLFG